MCLLACAVALFGCRPEQREDVSTVKRADTSKAPDFVVTTGTASAAVGVLDDLRIIGAPVVTRRVTASLVVVNLNEVRLYPAKNQALYFSEANVRIPAESAHALPFHQSLVSDYYVAVTTAPISLPTSATLHIAFNLVDQTSATVQLRESVEMEAEPLLAELHSAITMPEKQKLAVKRMLVALEKEVEAGDIRSAHLVVQRTRRVVAGDDESATTLTARLDRVLGQAATTYSLASQRDDVESARRALQYLRDDALKNL